MSEFPTFDELSKLAKEAPEKLEAFRQEQIEKLISQAEKSNRQRLRGLQFQIDAQRQIHRDSPLGACMRISEMMHESFAELRGWLNQVTDANDPLRGRSNNLDEVQEASVGKVLSFPAG